MIATPAITPQEIAAPAAAPLSPQEITRQLLVVDRQRAADVLLQLHYQLSRITSSIEIK